MEILCGKEELELRRDRRLTGLHSWTRALPTEKRGEAESGTFRSTTRSTKNTLATLKTIRIQLRNYVLGLTSASVSKYAYKSVILESACEKWRSQGDVSAIVF